MGRGQARALAAASLSEPEGRGDTRGPGCKPSLRQPECVPRPDTQFIAKCVLVHPYRGGIHELSEKNTRRLRLGLTGSPGRVVEISVVNIQCGLNTELGEPASFPYTETFRRPGFFDFSFLPERPQTQTVVRCTPHFITNQPV